MSVNVSLTLENTLEEMPRFESKLTELAQKGHLPADLVFQIHLAFDELFTNIVSYGYEDEGTHRIFVEISVAEDSVRIDLTDDGQPFNPLTETKDPDIDAELSERRIGGMGVHFVKTLMDEVTYNYVDNKNHIQFVKKFDS